MNAYRKEQAALWLARMHFDGPARRRTWRKLAAQLRHNVNLLQALTVMRDRCLVRKKRGMASVLTRILEGLSRGHSLDMAVADLVPAEERMLIRGGYKSGRLDEGLDLCADIIEARQGIFGAVIGAVAYPLVLFSMLVVILVVLSVEVVPALALVADPAGFTGAAAMLFRIAEVVVSPFGVVLFSLLIVGVVLILSTLPVWTGKVRLAVEETPPWSIYRLVVGTMWLFSVATLLRADIPLMQILDDMLTGNLRPWLRERIEAIRREYVLGKNLGRVLADTGLRFPDGEMVDDLVIYATLPDFHSQLHRLAREWLTDGTRRVKEQSAALNTLFLLCIIGLMCCLAMASMSIQQQLGSSMGGGF